LGIPEIVIEVNNRIQSLLPSLNSWNNIGNDVAEGMPVFNEEQKEELVELMLLQLPELQQLDPAWEQWFNVGYPQFFDDDQAAPAAPAAAAGAPMIVTPTRLKVELPKWNVEGSTEERYDHIAVFNAMCVPLGIINDAEKILWLSLNTKGTMKKFITSWITQHPVGAAGHTWDVLIRYLNEKSAGGRSLEYWMFQVKNISMRPKELIKDYGGRAEETISHYERVTVTLCHKSNASVSFARD
jgi:hypothetical protein